jgi:hypothetical protein
MKLAVPISNIFTNFKYDLKFLKISELIEISSNSLGNFIDFHKFTAPGAGKFVKIYAFTFGTPSTNGTWR